MKANILYRTLPSQMRPTTECSFAGHYTITRVDDGKRVRSLQFFMNRDHMDVKLAQWNAAMPARWSYEVAPLPVVSIGMDEIEYALASEVA
jgi:hypothetical protein